MLFALRMIATPLRLHVADVIALSANKEMLRIYTTTNVTAMQHAFVRLKMPAMKKKRKPMGKYAATVHAQNSVTVVVDPAVP